MKRGKIESTTQVSNDGETWKSAADVPALVYALEKRRKRAKIEGIVAFLIFLTIGAVMFEMMDPALREKALENCLVVVPGCMALQILMARAKKKKETKTNGAADASGETPKAEDDDAWGCAIFLFLLAALALITLIADTRDATYSVEVKLR